MLNFTYLLVTEDSNGAPLVFAFKDGGFIDLGDLVEHDGELFPVIDKCYLSTDSDEYRIFEKVIGIREPHSIYTITWKKTKEETK
jgi:hypothetical protein